MIKIGYLGPEGSFSEEAALSLKKDCKLIAFSSLELIGALEKGTIKWAVCPIENSTEGSVNWMFDLLLKNNDELVVEDEIILPIRHNLIGFGEIKEIKKILSHPQALAQCRKFIDDIKADTEDTDSTSLAVNLIAKSKQKNTAAIGTKRAAEFFEVPIIKEGIQDAQNNKTRFIVLGDEKRERTGNDKTSLVFGTKNVTGALVDVLMIFKIVGVNMTMIVSRPSKINPWEYVFFVDIEGHREDKKMKSAIRELKEKTTFLKILGSYPKAEARPLDV